MQVVIVGAGNVGYTLARTMSRKYTVMMVEQDEKRYRRILDSLDIGAMNANGGSPAVLKDLLTDKTGLFLAVTEKDEFNIFACQVAKKLRPEVSTIARVRNPDYMVGDIQWESFGVDRTFSPERLTASKMKKLAMVEDLIDYERVPGFGLAVAVFRVTERHDAGLFKPLKFMEMPPGSSILVIHRRGELLLPSKTENLQVGDEITILGPPGAIKEFNALLGRVHDPHDFVVVGGDIVAEQLLDILKDTKCSIKLIEKDETRCKWLSRKFGHAIIINDNGTDPSVLRDENVNMADALICTTDNEEENLLSCLIGKHLGVSKTITKFSRRDYEMVFDMSGVDAAIGTYHVVANELVRQTVPDLEVLVLMAGFDEALIGVPVAEKCIYMGCQVSELRLPDRSVLGMVIRNDRPVPPTSDLILSGGDLLLIYASRQDVPQLEHMFNTKIPLGP